MFQRPLAALLAVLALFLAGCGGESESAEPAQPTSPAVVETTAAPEFPVTVEVVAFDWNCPKFITPRYTADEVRAAAEPLRARIAELESVVASLGGHS